MSTCPDKDIHSIYIDDELQKKYEEEYLAHINQCDSCLKERNKLSKITSLLKEDSLNLEFSEEKLQNSFNQLQTKLRYSNNVRKIKPSETHNFTWIIPAAAAVLAFVLFMPMNKTSTKYNSTINTVPISIAGTQLNEGISTVETPKIKNDTGKIYNTGIYYTNTDYIPNISFTSQSPLIGTDFFRPHFNTEEHISVKISLDDFDTYYTIPVLMNIGMSMDERQ